GKAHPDGEADGEHRSGNIRTEGDQTGGPANLYPSLN
ncbi:unnamed protein product, partial [marine sediment metagenome]